MVQIASWRLYHPNGIYAKFLQMQKGKSPIETMKVQVHENFLPQHNENNAIRVNVKFRFSRFVQK